MRRAVSNGKERTEQCVFCIFCEDKKMLNSNFSYLTANFFFTCSVLAVSCTKGSWKEI